MMKLLKKWLLYAGMEPEAFKTLLPEARKENAARLKLYSSIATVLFAVLFFAGLFSGNQISVNLIYYGLMLVFSGAVCLCAHVALPKQLGLTPVVVYTFAGAALVFSLRIAQLHPNQPAVTAVAIMMMVPLLFFDRPIYFIIMTILHVIALWIISYTGKSADTAVYDLWNGITFGIVAIVIGYHHMEGRFHMLAQTRHIRYLSETDLLTGAKNRNCYERRQRDYAAQCTRNVVCVYADVNGLHELNNTRGHAAGDEMLKAVGAALIDAFGGENVYRVGGDEFVAFGVDIPEEEAHRRTAAISAAMVDRQYHISAGVASGERDGLDMAALTAGAEREMFRDKQRYYQQAGHDRRRRRED